jgi:putative hydrolase of the HAD superfamily
MLKPGNVEVVFFDAAGTLFKVRGSVGQIYSDVAKRHGIEVPAGTLDRAFKIEFSRRSQPVDGILPGTDPDGESLSVLERRWWADLVRELFQRRMPPEVFERYFDEVFEVFRTEQGWELYSDTRACLDCLTCEGYRLGVISNFDSRLIDLLPRLGIDGYFEQRILSWQTGFAKPDPRIFLNAVERMGVAAVAALHVGDSPKEDVDAARAAGLQSILLDREGTSELRPDRITTLLELCRFLRRTEESLPVGESGGKSSLDQP